MTTSKCLTVVTRIRRFLLRCVEPSFRMISGQMGTLWHCISIPMHPWYIRDFRWHTPLNHNAQLVGVDQIHDDVIKWKHFPRYWPFVRGIHRSPVNSTHKGQWRGALMLPLICVWTNAWVNNRDAGDLRRYPVHYDVTVMLWINAIHTGVTSLLH